MRPARRAPTARCSCAFFWRADWNRRVRSSSPRRQTCAKPRRRLRSRGWSSAATSSRWTNRARTSRARPPARPPGSARAAAAGRLLETVLTQLDEAQRAEPWSMGMTSIALARTLGVSEGVLVRVLEHFVADGRLLNRRGYYATLEHQPELTLEQRAF